MPQPRTILGALVAVLAITACSGASSLGSASNSPAPTPAASIEAPASPSLSNERTISPSPSLEAASVIHDLEAIAGGFGVFCRSFPSREVPSPAAIRQALGIGDTLAGQLDRLSALKAPKGWLKIINDSQQLADKVRSAFVMASFTVQQLETGSPKAAAETWQTGVRDVCDWVPGEVLAISEAIDAMP
jgi:hypothetical protein